MKNESDYIYKGAKLFCIAVYIVGGYLLLKYVLPAAFPFVLALVVSFAISRTAGGISKRTKIPQGVCAFLIVSALLLLLGALIYFVLSRLVLQISALVGGISDGALDSLFCSLEKIPLIGEFVFDTEEYAKNELTPIFSRALEALCEGLGSIATAAISASPRLLFSGIVYIMCIYYMSVDFDAVVRFFKRILPQNAFDGLRGAKRGALVLGVKFLRAYALIFAVTLSEIFLALCILCPQYALAGALIIALIDVLPVFGAGLVLLPWGIASLILGDTFVGVGLLVLYLIITVTHRIIEPRLIGDCVGIHPLASLLCMYVGYRFFGMAGMIFLPFAVSALMGEENERKWRIKC